MVTLTSTETIPGEPETWELLASSRRRVVLTELATTETVTLERLTDAVLDRELPAEPEEADDDRRTEVAVDLAHVHLPKLESADAVAFDADERVVTREVHPVHDSPVVRPEVDDEPAQSVCEALADARRQVALAVLRDRESLHAADLATRVVAGERDCDVDAVPDDAAELCLASLHHAHLPTLEGAGFVAWDPDEGRVSAVADLPDPLSVGDDEGTTWESVTGHTES